MKTTLALLLAAATAVMAAPRPQVGQPAGNPNNIVATTFFTFTDASGVGNRDFIINVPAGAARFVEVAAQNNPPTLSGISLDNVQRFDGGNAFGIACSVFCDGANASGQEAGVVDLDNSFLDLAVCSTISGLVCG